MEVPDRPRRLARRWRPVFFLGLLAAGGLQAFPGYLNTRSTEFYPRGRVGLSVGLERFEDRGPYGTWPLVFSAVPVSIATALARNVQLGLTLPFVWVENLARPDRSLALVAGDMVLDMEFGHDEPEYDYREAFTFRVRIPDTSPPIDRNRRLSTLERDYAEGSTVRDYYPLTLHHQEMALGWNFSKQLGEKTWLHFNARYVYEFGTNESLTNMFALQGALVSTNDISTITNAEALAGTTFSLFGIEKIWERFFGWTGRVDPWADKANDRVELSLGVDTTLDLGYHVSGRKIPFAIQPFAELFLSKRFTEESLAKSHLDLSAGAAFHLPAHLRLQFAFTRVLWADARFDYQDALRMNLTILL